MPQKSIFDQLCEEGERFVGGVFEKKLPPIHSRSKIKAVGLMASDVLRVVVCETVYWNGDGWISTPHARMEHIIRKSREGMRLEDGRVLIKSLAGDFSFYPRGLLKTIDGELCMIA